MSTPAVSRADFQQLADIRIKEAESLLNLGLWDGAYYLAGYAAEIALKACIIKKLMATDAFPEKKFSTDCWTHDLTALIKLAGLASVWDAALNVNPQLAANWVIVKVWKEDARYHRITDTEAIGLHSALTDAIHGVLTWIKTQW